LIVPLRYPSTCVFKAASRVCCGKRQMTERTISMKLTWYGHSAFFIEAGAVKILIDPFLSDHPSWDKGWIGSVAGEDLTRGGGR
jgi:hypothetical protein